MASRTYGDYEKRIVFTETDKTHAELKIKLHYEGLRQAQFFRMMIQGFLQDDPNIVKFIEEYKLKNNITSKRQRKIVAKEREGQKDTKSKFALNQNEIDSIFDMLEREQDV
jgi:hypothetical protein